MKSDKKEKTAQENKKSEETEKISPEEVPEEAPVPAEAAEPEIDPLEELKKELEAAKAQAEDMKRKWYSVTAEYENYRRRTAGESAKRYTEGRADVVSKLFPIADNLDRALKSCTEEQTKRGIELVMKAFSKILEEEKITVINPVGEEFDAETCEAVVAVDPMEGEESGTVREVFLKGYMQNGKVLRFAQVIVVK